MSPAPAARRATAIKRAPAGRKKRKASWIVWLPLAIGVAATPLARRSADVLAMEGPRALQMLYPWIALLKIRALGLSDDTAGSLSQFIMYLQFPLYGVFMALAMRAYGFARALLWTVLLHAAPLAVVLGFAHA